MFPFLGQVALSQGDERPAVPTVDVGALPFLLERYPQEEEEVREAQGAYLAAYDVWVEANEAYMDAARRHRENPTPETLREMRDAQDAKIGMEETVEIYKYRADQEYRELIQLNQKIETIKKLVDAEYPEGPEFQVDPLVAGAAGVGVLAFLVALI